MKFNENRSESSGNMGRTGNLRVNPMTMNRDLDQEGKTLALHTVSLKLRFEQSLMKIFERAEETWSGHEIQD